MSNANVPMLKIKMAAESYSRLHRQPRDRLQDDCDRPFQLSKGKQAANYCRAESAQVLFPLTHFLTKQNSTFLWINNVSKILLHQTFQFCCPQQWTNYFFYQDIVTIDYWEKTKSDAAIVFNFLDIPRIFFFFCEEHKLLYGWSDETGEGKVEFIQLNWPMS